MPGTPLSELLAGPRCAEALRAVGSAARLHRTTPPAGSSLRSRGRAGGHPGLGAVGSLRLIHRDLHDGQFLLTTDAAGDFTDNGVGLLDFELNLLLRRRQGVLADAESAVEALLTGYQPDKDTTSRVATYRALAARRLAAVYAFRAPNLVTSLPTSQSCCASG
jgi:hypothetical protein